MKYIRTNDNQIINVGKLKIDYDIKIVGNYLQVFCKFGITPVETYEITKQADTIEELCDEFVIKPKNNMKNWLAFGVNVKHLKESIYNLNYPIKEVFGAIWTDKGLIFVAKMNEKGELKLL